MAGGIALYKSYRQRLVTLSSTESEYIAMTYAAKEVSWVQRLPHSGWLHWTDNTINWQQDMKTEILQWIYNDRGIKAKDIEHGYPLDVERWPISKPRERIMVSTMVTMIKLLRDIPVMMKDCAQWWPVDSAIFAKHKMIIDERSPEHLHAAFFSAAVHLARDDEGAWRSKTEARSEEHRKGFSTGTTG